MGIADDSSGAAVWIAVGGLQDELEYILGHKVRPYWQAYLLGIPTLFIYPLIWMARIAEELKGKAEEMGVEGPYTSWWHMFGWNVFGLLLMGPPVATMRFFDTLNRVEEKMNRIREKTSPAGYFSPPSKATSWAFLLAQNILKRIFVKNIYCRKRIHENTFRLQLL